MGKARRTTASSPTAMETITNTDLTMAVVIPHPHTVVTPMALLPRHQEKSVDQLGHGETNLDKNRDHINFRQDLPHLLQTTSTTAAAQRKETETGIATVAADHHLGSEGPTSIHISPATGTTNDLLDREMRDRHEMIAYLEMNESREMRDRPQEMSTGDELPAVGVTVQGIGTEILIEAIMLGIGMLIVDGVELS